MKAVIIPESSYEAILAKLDEIQAKLDSASTSKQSSFVDNQKFLKLMGISSRTAQNWRDEGYISFSQIGNKIYYKTSDVEQLLEKHHIKSFKGFSRNL